MGALSWLSEFVEFFADLVPRIRVCTAKQSGVKFVKGRVRPIKPGLFMFWPITTRVALVETSRQTLNLASQTLTTSDGYSVLVSAVVVYRVEDSTTVLVEVSDWEDTLGDAALGSVVDVVGGSDFDHIRENLTGEIERLIRHKIRLTLKPYGIKVERAFLSDFAECKVYRVAGDGHSSVVPE